MNLNYKNLFLGISVVSVIFIGNLFIAIDVWGQNNIGCGHPIEACSEIDGCYEVDYSYQFCECAEGYTPSCVSNEVFCRYGATGVDMGYLDSCTTLGGCTCIPPSPPPTGYCGDGICQSGESCEEDCGGEPQQPDLTAGAATPVAAVTGAPTTINAPITNIGNQGVGFFWNHFEVSTAANGGGWVSNAQSGISIDTLAAGETKNISGSYTFPSAGTYSLRACADQYNNTSGTGDIAEPNEGNNCGGWVNVTVSAAVSHCDGNWKAIPGGGATIGQPVGVYVPATTNTQGALEDSVNVVVRGTDNHVYYRICNFNGTNECSWNANWSVPPGNQLIAVSPFTSVGSSWDIIAKASDNFNKHTTNLSTGWQAWYNDGTANLSYGTPFRFTDKINRTWQLRSTAGSIEYMCGATGCVNLYFDSSRSGFSPASANAGDTVNVTCDYRAVTNAIGVTTSPAGGLTGCTPTGWDRTQASFQCTAGGSGSYQVSCSTVAGTSDNICSQTNGLGSLTTNTACSAPANMLPTGTISNTTVSLSWDESAGATYYDVRLNDNTNGSLRFDDTRYTTCPSSPHYYCENGIPAASICSGGRCTITGVPVVDGHSYGYWIDTASCGTGSTSFAVSVPPPPATADIRVNGSNGPVTITRGEEIDVTWTSANATSCVVQPTGWTGLSAGSGSHTLSLFSGPVTYEIYCDPPAAGARDDFVTVNVSVPATMELNVIKSGQGTVTSSPAGINCGPGCSNQTASFSTDSTVTLTAIPAAGRRFTGWSGACSGRGSCSVLMDEEKTVIANFSVDPSYNEF